MKKTFTITAEIPAGYEPSGEYRIPLKKEHFLGEYGHADQALGECNKPKMILLKEWSWPDWIKSGTWIAMDENGTWGLFGKEPVLVSMDSTEWISEAQHNNFLTPDLLDFTPPTCTDWRKSKRQKP